MKLALVVPGGVDASGERRVIPAVLSLVRRLARRHEVHVFSLFHQREAGRWPLLGAEVHNPGGGNNLVCEWCALQAMRAEHRRAPFDVIQSLWGGPCGVAAVWAGRVLHRPVAVHLAGGELAAVPDIGWGGALKPWGRWRERWVLRQAKAVTAASQPMLALAAAVGVQAMRLPLGADADVWPITAPRPRKANAPLRLVQVASLNRVKDQPCLLRALALLREQGVDAVLDQIGADTLGGEVQRLAARLGLAGHVRFHGELTQAQLRPLVLAADLHVITSRHEAGPLAVLEAALCGVPSVGTAVGHLREWAPHAARVVPPGDALGLAGVLAELAQDDVQRLALAERAQAIARAEDADATARQFEQLHERLASASGR